ncbi:MAG TPA: Gfo/Idh/MocA family oxidoreductase [Clostridiaceae bacterium]|nr:Gfo/Idh/MocA family oxidoreductase [Clostridiaceae bacterium]
MEKRAFPLGDKELKLGIIGMTEGNGHPYSWSAIFNGYDCDFMNECPYPAIPSYLNKQPKHTFGIPGAHVTHIYCDDRTDAEHVAKCSLIPNVVDKPEEMIGEVDAVIIATDIGSEHVKRCRPFIEADIPLFIDKPLVDNEDDLKIFTKWHDEGFHFLSSSSMRYQKEMEPYHKNHYELGKLMYIFKSIIKKWETYGIHALENIYPVLGPGFVSIQNTGNYEKNIVHIVHKSGCDINIVVASGIASAPTLLVGSESTAVINSKDSYYSFKKQLDTFVRWLRTGEEPYPYEETQELMKLVIGGIRSREEGNRKVYLDEIKVR